jgi:hypothetical protein
MEKVTENARGAADMAGELVASMTSCAAPERAFCANLSGRPANVEPEFVRSLPIRWQA